MSSTYPPLDTLKPVAENLWIVDGPVIRFGFPHGRWLERNGTAELRRAFRWAFGEGASQLA